jgi:membrane protein DedA with SNARE-associated domain
METLLKHFIDYQLWVIFIGTFIEGEVVLVAGGFLVSEGHLPFSTLVLTATLAAIIGDNFFYWIGRSQRTGMRHPWAAGFVRFVGEHRLFRGEEFMRRHGGKSVFIVRFFYGLRFAGAMTAGILGMEMGRFFFFNFVGCVAWAVMIGGLGYLLTEIGFLLVVAGLVAIYLLNTKRKRNVPQ